MHPKQMPLSCWCDSNACQNVELFDHLVNYQFLDRVQARLFSEIVDIDNFLEV